jgi:hypothetical protein
MQTNLLVDILQEEYCAWPEKSGAGTFHIGIYAIKEFLAQ